MRAYVVIGLEFDPDAGQTLDMRYQVLMRGPKEHFAETGEEFIVGPVWATVDPQDIALLTELAPTAQLDENGR